MTKSFRTILDEHLNEGKAAPSATFQSSAARSHELWIGAMDWTSPRTAPTRPASAYARETRLSREAARRASRTVTEPSIPLVRLSNADLADVRRLIELGAVSLEDGLSARKLKAAYRQLARRYHPDVNAGIDPGVFLEVHAAYGRVLGHLPKY